MNLYERIYRKRWDSLDRVSLVWRVIVAEFLQRFIPRDARVLDIGCGYCHFLNHVQAREKVGVDANPDVSRYANPDIRIVQTDNLSLTELPENYFDVVFLSNFLEHLGSGAEVISLLSRVHELLAIGGKVIVLQPNFRLLGAAYFDFIDHKAVLTERSMEEAFEVTGFTLETEIVRFLPYTTRQRIPQSPFLVSLYLKLPLVWQVLGKQSLFVATK